MQIAIKTIWITAIVAVSLSMTWFLLGSTAFFQRGIDLVTTFIFVWVWAPALLLTGLSIFLLKKGWLPSNILAQIGLILGIIILSLIFTTTFFRYSSTNGWLKERVTNDYLQTTLDGKYEYRLEVINMFQKNSYSRLYVKDISTDEEMKISLDIPMREIGAVQGGVGSIYPEPAIPPVWSELTLSDTEPFYILTTTDKFYRSNIYLFKIDMETRTAQRIE